MTIFGAVFARGGSKGIPGKNLRKLAGKSLLELSVSLGLELPAIDQMICSTDSEEIAAEAKRLGADVPFLRPSRLAGDKASEWGAWQHLATYLIEQGASDSDILLSLPTTSPLRAREDVDAAIETFRAGSFDVVLAVTESAHNPWFNMVKRESASTLVELAVSAGKQPVDRRQDAPQLYDITTVVYVTTLGFALRASRMLEGKVGSIIIPPDRAIDIDTELDLEIAEYLALKRLGLDRG